MGLFGATNQDISDACLGGFLISIATTAHLLLKGRITSMSSLLQSFLTFDKIFYWKMSLICSMLTTSSLFFILKPSSF